MTVETEKRDTDKIEFPVLHVDQKNQGELQASIKALEEEELQLSEVNEIEKTHLAEVVSHLKQAAKSLDTPIRIDPAAFSEVVLAPEGSISLLNNGSLITSIPLLELPGSAMITVLLQAVPELKRLAVEKKSATAERATILEKSAKEFRKVTAAIGDKEKSLS